MKHTNLFHYAANETEFYEALQRDFERDEKRSYRAQLTAAGLFLFGALLDRVPMLQWLLAGGALYAMFYALRMFIDNSNRNWTMHLIDWSNKRADKE